MWVLVGIVITLAGANVGMSYQPTSLAECESLLNRTNLAQWAAQWERQEANAGWLKCVPYDPLKDALEAEFDKAGKLTHAR